MPTTTYTPLANLTLSSSAASVTFSSISQAYRDLVLVVEGTIASGYAPDIYAFYNSDQTQANYKTIFMYGTGSTTSSFTATDARVAGFQDRNSLILNVMDYSATDKHKTSISRYNTGNTSYGLGAVAMRWANTSAITSLKLDTGGGVASFQSGTTFALYGIAA